MASTSLFAPQIRAVQPAFIYYEKTKEQAMLALKTWPGGFQVGGGITAENASEFLDAGASHVIVTSYVFKDGQINYDNLKKLVKSFHLLISKSNPAIKKKAGILNNFKKSNIYPSKFGFV